MFNQTYTDVRKVKICVNKKKKKTYVSENIYGLHFITLQIFLKSNLKCKKSLSNGNKNGKVWKYKKELKHILHFINRFSFK